MLQANASNKWINIRLLNKKNVLSTKLKINANIVFLTGSVHKWHCAYWWNVFNQHLLSFMALTRWFRCFSLVNWPHFTVTKPRLKEFRLVLKGYCCRRELKELKEFEPEKFRGHLQNVKKNKKKKKKVRVCEAEQML